MGLFDIFSKKNNTTAKTKQEELDEEFKRLHGKLTGEMDAQNKRNEQEIQQVGRIMSDVEGRIQQFNSAPGEVRANAVASEQAQNVAQELGISNLGLPRSQTTFKNSAVLTSEDFDKKFPHYKELKKIISDRQSGTLSSQVSKRLDFIISNCKQHYSEFSLNDLLIPFLIEKKAMGIGCEQEEYTFLSTKEDTYRYINGYSQNEYNEAVTYYIVALGAFFELEGERAKDFVQSFECCHTLKANYALYGENAMLQDNSKSSGSRR